MSDEKTFLNETPQEQEKLTTPGSSTIKYTRSGHESRLRVVRDFSIGFYDRRWRMWQGRAEEFWDARLQPRILWEYEKNGRGKRR